MVADKVNNLFAPYRQKLQDVNKQLTDAQDPEQKKHLELLKTTIEAEANALAQPLNEELKTLGDTEGLKKTTIEFNPENFNQVTKLFKDEGVKRFRVIAPCLEIADALGIE